MYMLDIDGIVTSWNPGAQQLKGYREEEIVGQSFSCFFTEEDRNSWIPTRSLDTSLRTGHLVAEGWRVRKNGTRFWAQVMIDPIRTACGKFLGFVKITRDLTERKLTEEARQRSNAEFRHLVLGVSEYALFTLDLDGRIRKWNFGAQQTTGYKCTEVVGTHFSRFYTVKDQRNGQPQKALAIAVQEGKYGSEGWRPRKDGTRFWAQVVIEPIREADGTLIGFAKFTRDATTTRTSRRQSQPKFDATRPRPDQDVPSTGAASALKLCRPNWAGFRMEQALWNALGQICILENLSPAEVIDHAKRLQFGSEEASSIRIYIFKRMQTMHNGRLYSDSDVLMSQSYHALAGVLSARTMTGVISATSS